MKFMKKFNKEIRFLLRAIDGCSKCTWVAPLKHKECVTITDAFQNVFNESRRKPNKIWVDKGSKFYKRSMKSWFQDNNMKMYSTCNERKSVVSERFIRTLKNKIYKYMTSISKNVYIDKLGGIVN